MGRPKISNPKRKIQVRLPQPINARLGTTAEHLRVTKSDIVAYALEMYFALQDNKKGTK